EIALRQFLSAYTNGTPVSFSDWHSTLTHDWVWTAVSALRLITPLVASLTRPPGGIWMISPASGIVSLGDTPTIGFASKVLGQSCCKPSSGAHCTSPSPLRSP